MTQLNIGDKAPNFSTPNQHEDIVNLSDLSGQKVVLFFYPKDNTPGCTKESIGFSEAMDEFEALNVIVLGISADSAAKHTKFIEKHDLKMDLLADEQHAALDAFGVWKEKSMYGKTFMGIERSTFVISESGEIEAIWRKVKVNGHVEEVLAHLKK